MTLSLELLHRPFDDPNRGEFTILEDGKSIAVIELDYVKEKELLLIEGIAATDENGEAIEDQSATNLLGPSKVREILRLLKKKFPRATQIGGARVTGMSSKSPRFITVEI